jgi:hypothetical protein
MMYPLVKELAAGEGTGVCQQERTTKRPGFLCEGAPVRRLTQEW